MPAPFGNIQNVNVAGACQVTYKGLDLGHTLGGIDITLDRSFKDVVVDRYGDMPIDRVLTGNKITLKMTLAEGTWRTLDTAIPESTSLDGGAGKQRVDFGSETGYSVRVDSGLLVIHPNKNATLDLSEDINVYRAVSQDAVGLPYKVDAQKAVAVTFVGLVDETYGTDRRLGHYGPAAIS